MEAIQELLKGIFYEILIYAMTAIIPIVGIIIGRLLLHITKQIDNDTFRRLAQEAVLFAEDKIGPDTGFGQAKLAVAVDFLVSKTKLTPEQAEQLVRAAYQNIFGPFKDEQPS